MRLVACRSCHIQYDVSEVAGDEIRCRCGERIEMRLPRPSDLRIQRCGSCGAQVADDAERCEYCGAAIVRDTRKLSLICPECFGRNAEGSRYCTACGIAFRPRKVEVEGRELPCPCCACLMPVREVGGAGINECPKCNGLWVPENRFDHLIARACEAARSERGARVRSQGARLKGANPARSEVVYRKCPVCEAYMRRTNFRKRSGVVIDRCSRHGTWLDVDELERIAGFILEGGMGETGAREHLLAVELEAVRRRELEAHARVVRGESITLERVGESGLGRGLLGLLKDLLTS